MCSPCVKQLAADALGQDYTEEQIDETLDFLVKNGVLKVSVLATVREADVVAALDQGKASLGLRAAVHRLHAWAMVEVAKRSFMPGGPSFTIAKGYGKGKNLAAASPQSSSGTRLPAGIARSVSGISMPSPCSTPGYSTGYSTPGYNGESPAGWANGRPDLSPAPCSGGAGWAAQVTGDMTVLGSLDEKRTIACLPRHCNEPDGKKWKFDIDHEPTATVGELRKQISSCIKVPMGKVRLASAGNKELDDGELASDATELFLYSTPDGGKPKSSKAEKRSSDVTPLTTRRAKALQQEFLMALESPRARKMKAPELLKHVQAKVLPSYGFGTDIAGVFSMLRAFDTLVEDQEITRVGDTINSRLGNRPQMYDIDECFDRFGAA